MSTAKVKIFLAALSLAALSGCALVLAKRDRREPPKAAPAWISATGRVEARREAVVRSKASGRVLEYLKTERDWAKQGEPIVLLDQDLERAAVKEAEAEFFRANQRFKRFAALHEEKVVSDQEYDDAKAADRLASAQLERASAALEERIVRAPFSGRILKTYLESGESIAPGSAEPLFVIGDTRGLRVVAEIDELDIARLAIGSPAEVIPNALSGETFKGKVARIAGILGRKRLSSEDPGERLDAKVLEAEVELPASERLRPGLNVEVRIRPAA